MKRVVIFGISRFAEMIYYYLLENASIEVCFFTAEKKHLSNEKTKQMPLETVPFESLSSGKLCEEYQVLPVIGYDNMNEGRRRVFSLIRETGFGMLSYFHPTAIIANNVSIGEGCIILENTIIQPYVTIGEGNIFWSNVNISHHVKIGDYNFFAPSCSLAGDVTVTENCFIGNNATVRNGILIRPFTLVGAGTYISHDTQRRTMYSPARAISREYRTDILI